MIRLYGWRQLRVRSPSCPGGCLIHHRVQRGTWTLVQHGLAVTVAVGWSPAIFGWLALRKLLNAVAVAAAVWLLRLRRTAGLLAFFYARLHFTTYIWFDRFFDWR